MKQEWIVPFFLKKNLNLCIVLAHHIFIFV